MMFLMFNQCKIIVRPAINTYLHKNRLLTLTATRINISTRPNYVHYVRYSTKTSNTGKGTVGVPLWRSVLTNFVPIGLCLVAVMQWRTYRKRSRDRVASQFEISCYCGLPLRTMSRWWGYLADIELPKFLRPVLYGAYVNTFGVNLSEAVNSDLKSYSSLSDFFVREIKSEVRPVDQKSCMVSPCDGTVLHFGTVQMGKVEQVKGVTYSLEDFFGEITWNKSTHCDYHTKLLHKPEEKTVLYQCVIYLAPGDYHRFHSPVEWSPTYRRHFPGQLLSVNPSIANWLPGLFCLNERAVYIGQWKHGFFSYTAVGATNVGSIRVNFDRKLQTNCAKPSNTCKDKCLGSNVSLRRGDLIGEFRMGSTVVLIFEAPASFRFNVTPGDKVKMGQGLGCVRQKTHTENLNSSETKNDLTK